MNVKRAFNSVKSGINKLTDWLISHVPEPVKQVANKLRERIYGRSKPPAQILPFEDLDRIDDELFPIMRSRRGSYTFQESASA